jgi:hypothetical protein
MFLGWTARHARTCALVTAMLGPTAASAALLDLGNTTQDTSTGLEWLDVTLSTNKSFDEVSSQFNVGGEFFGYRYASGYEVSLLFTDAGVSNPYTGPGHGGDENDHYFALMDLLGMTLVTSDQWETRGITSDHSLARIMVAGPCPAGDPTVGCYVALSSYDAFPSTEKHPWVGSFLVQISDAPVPAALPLFATGLGLLGFAARRRKRTSIHP